MVLLKFLRDFPQKVWQGADISRPQIPQTVSAGILSSISLKIVSGIKLGVTVETPSEKNYRIFSTNSLRIQLFPQKSARILSEEKFLLSWPQFKEMTSNRPECIDLSIQPPLWLLCTK